MILSPNYRACVLRALLFSFAFSSTALLLATSPVAAQAPALSALAPAGAQIGANSRLRLNGQRLHGNLRLLAPFECNFSIESSNDGQAADLSLELPVSVLPGIYEIQIANEQGASNVLQLVVDPCRHIESTTTAEALPVAITGTLSGANVAKLRIEGHQGQLLVMDALSNQLGSNLRPVIRLLNSEGKQLSTANPTKQLGGDARCQFELPADGEYEIQLHDVLYRAPGNARFVLRAGYLKAAHQVFPVGISDLEPSPVALISGETVVESWAENQLADYPGWTPLPVSDPTEWLGPLPQVWRGSARELVESVREGNQVLELGQVPVAVSGCLEQGDERDRYKVSCRPGQKLHVELWAERIGAPIDGILIVRGNGGQELARMDDRPGTTDPALDVVVPADTESVSIEVIELNRATGSNHCYRLAVSDVTSGIIAPGLSGDALNVPQGGRRYLQIPINRNGYQGALTMNVVGLGDVWSLSGTRVPSRSDMALLVIGASDTEANIDQRVCFGFMSTGPDGVVNQQLQPIMARRQVPNPIQRLYPTLGYEMMVAAAPTVERSISWMDTETTLQGYQGGVIPVRLQLSNPNDNQSNYRLRIITTQAMPKKTIKVDNKDQVVDDVDRAIRLESAIEFGAEMTEVSGSIQLPTDLPEAEWGVALVLEKNVSENNFVLLDTTEVRYFQSMPGMQIALTGTEQPIAASKGMPVTLSGQLTRINSLAGTIQIQVSGLPDGYESQPFELGEESPNFQLIIKVPAEAAPGEIANLRLDCRHVNAEGQVVAHQVSAPFKLNITE